jgi:hypothetical protein
MKERRFIAIPESQIFFLTLIEFWAEHEQALKEWCKENNCVHKGMTVEALDEQAFLMFMLRWT